jgi:DNA-binding MarR family transcriptional regulator
MEHSNKWNIIADYLKSQNKHWGIKAFSRFLTLSHLIDNYLEEKLSGDGVNRTQRMIIMLILDKGEPMAPTEISQISYRPIDTINKSIKVLDKLGLTISFQSEEDRRIRKVTLTEKGVELAEKDVPLRSMAFFQAMSCFTNEEAKQFAEYLYRVQNQIIHIKKQNSKKTQNSR